MSKLSYQELETQIVGLRSQLAVLRHALTWIMLKLQYREESPIVGGDPTIKPFLQIYQEEMAGLAAAQKAEQAALDEQAQQEKTGSENPN